MIITQESKIKDVLNSPAGHDIIARVLYSVGLDENLLKGFIGNLKLKHLSKLSFGKLDDNFIDSLLNILNSQANVEDDDCEIKKVWWKQATFYEIYPRSFKDSNNDGIGDIRGIISKLDYLKDLGVDALWICPFYDSPNADNGYDVRDYRKIMKEFGTLQDVEELIAEAHSREIKIIVDLVMNHTSDEHEWYQKALQGDPKYSNYYIFKDKPNNWTSCFSGPAWKYVKEKDKYALHLFAEKQIDLNWENPDVRQEMYDVANFWLEKGADGFRLDVVSFISKDNYEDGNEKLGKLIGFTGIEHYFHGPKLDEYLRELNDKTLNKHHAYTVGECPGNGLKMSRLITGDDRNELSQLFSFDHIDNPGKVRFLDDNFDLRKMIPELVRWQTQYSNHCWPTIFFDNHDNPRMISKISKGEKYREVVGKLLALLQFSLKGTPYMYQGCEIGMDNTEFLDMSEIRDIESLQYYEQALKQGKTKQEAFKIIMTGTRDHARTPVAWDDSEYGGFSSVEPWIKANPSYKHINVKAQEKDEHSILNFTKNINKYRKAHQSLIYGTFKQVKTSKDYFVYTRKLDEEYLIVMNLTDKNKKYPVNTKGTLLFNNYPEIKNELRPYEAHLYKIN
ncbi:MAG: alpha-glucosidase [Firmicutes bacterium]|nr:alpha-glucosidase [Candidatus Colivicinus equi]